MEQERWALLKEEMAQRYLTARDHLVACREEELIDARAHFRAIHHMLLAMQDIEGAVAAVEMPLTPSEETVERQSREGDGNGRKRPAYRNAGY